MPEPRRLNPPALETPPGYTHVIEVSGPHRTIYIAGQLGSDLSGKIVSPDFREQTVKAFENLKAALAAAGADFRHLVKIVNYITDMSQIAVYKEIRDSFFDPQVRPVSTLVEISRLARPDAKFEIEAIAVVPE